MWEPEMTSTALNSDKKWAFLLILRADWFVLIKVLKSQHAFRLKCKSLRGNCSHCHFDTRSTFSPCSNVSLLCHTATAVPSPLSAPRHTAKILHFSNVSRKTARLGKCISPNTTEIYNCVYKLRKLYINYISILKILRDISVTMILYYVQIDIPTKLMSFML